MYNVSQLLNCLKSREYIGARELRNEVELLQKRMREERLKVKK